MARLWFAKERKPAITPELIAAHCLKPDEFQRILDIIGREPTFTELGIFSPMWKRGIVLISPSKKGRYAPCRQPARKVDLRPRRECGRGGYRGRSGRACSDGKAITTRPILNPIRVQRLALGILRYVLTMGARAQSQR